MSLPEVLRSEPQFQGYVFRVETDTLRFPDGSETSRDVVRHPGAVGVVAVDDQRRVMLISQYRHPVGRELLELPAGLLDQAGEPASLAAARELAEEVGLRATIWSTLLDASTSSGMTDEAVRLYLATDISIAPDTGFVREHEELDLKPRWVPLDDAVAMIFTGEIVNSLCIMGLLATQRFYTQSPAPVGLRRADAPWRDRPSHQG